MHYDATDNMDSAHFGFLVVSLSPGCIFEGNLLKDLHSCKVGPWGLKFCYLLQALGIKAI